MHDVLKRTQNFLKGRSSSDMGPTPQHTTYTPTDSSVCQDKPLAPAGQQFCSTSTQGVTPIGRMTAIQRYFF